MAEALLGCMIVLVAMPENMMVLAQDMMVTSLVARPWIITQRGKSTNKLATDNNSTGGKATNKLAGGKSTSCGFATDNNLFEGHCFAWHLRVLTF